MWLLVCALLGATPVGAAPSVTPRPPLTPAIEAGSRTFVAFAGQPAAVRIRWAPVLGAARYRARFTAMGKPVDVELPGIATAFERAEPSPGHHELALVAIDSGGRESPPAQVGIDVVSVVGLAPGADEPGPPGAGAFAIGARFSSPGLRCQLGNGALASEVVATAAGTQALRCGEAGQPNIAVGLVIVPVMVVADVAPIRLQTPTRIHVSVASVAPIGDHLEIEALGDLDLGEAERTAGGLDIPLTALGGSANASLVIRAGVVELGRIALPLLDAPPSVPEARAGSDWFALDIGGRIGVFMAPKDGRDATVLGMPDDPSDALGSGPFAGVGAGLFPLRRIGFEVQLAVAAANYAGRFGVAGLVLSRAQLALRLVDEQRLGLRLLLGGDVLGVLTDAGTSRRSAVGGVHYGAGFTIEIRPRVSIRFDALHVVTVARDAGYAHCVEASVSMITRLGRRDRWR